jgi:hypothetical protein
MDDGNQAVQATSTQPPVSTPAPASAPEGFVEIARLNGALQKIQELTLLNKTLTERHTELSGKYTTAQADLVQKESVWNAQQSEFTTKLGSADKAIADLTAKQAAAEALRLKLKFIEEAKAPQLYAVMDVIPDTTDEAVLKASIQKLAAFAGQIATTREKELTAGVIPAEQRSEGPAAPTTDEEWDKLVNSLPFGSPERSKAMEKWHAWLFK